MGKKYIVGQTPTHLRGNSIVSTQTLQPITSDLFSFSLLFWCLLLRLHCESVLLLPSYIAPDICHLTSTPPPVLTQRTGSARYTNKHDMAVSLSAEAIVDSATLGVAILDLVFQIWRYYKSRQEQSATRQALGDRERAFRRIICHLLQPLCTSAILFCQLIAQAYHM